MAADRSFVIMHKGSLRMLKAYGKEERAFSKTAGLVRLRQVPADANVISSHVLYKVKKDNDESLRLKARIPAHGIEDSTRNDLRSDCSMSAAHEVRIRLSTAVPRKWTLIKLDVESTILQTGAPARELYVIPPLESFARGKSL